MMCWNKEVSNGIYNSSNSDHSCDWCVGTGGPMIATAVIAVMVTLAVVVSICAMMIVRFLTKWGGYDVACNSSNSR